MSDTMTEMNSAAGGMNAAMNGAMGLSSSFAKVPVTVQVMLGTARLPLPEMLALQAGSTLTLEQKLGAPVSIIVNGCRIANGELYVIEGEGDRLGVKITELFNEGANGAASA